MEGREGMMTGRPTGGVAEGEFSEVELPSGDICRMYQDGRVECKKPGEKEYTPRGAPKDGPKLGDPLPDLNIRF